MMLVSDKLQLNLKIIILTINDELKNITQIENSIRRFFYKFIINC